MATAGKKSPPHCTVEQLSAIITAPSGGLYMMPSRGMDEVYPGIYVGDEESARNILTLQKLGITHVLNTAKGKDRYHVNTNREMYQKQGLAFLGIEATDAADFKIAKFFPKTADFIDEALQAGGKVLVHCREGYSRSATIATAYLVTSRHMTAQDALRLIRDKREVGPNEGFQQELCDLNEKLWKSGHFNENSEQKANESETTHL